MLGINDFGRDVPLGQLGDQTTVTFYGALRQMLGQISKHYPQATIYFISHVKIGTDFSRPSIKVVIDKPITKRQLIKSLNY
ncbi:SGNH/GDSL hydrolase family protein [Latilactobacillus sakei]